MVNFPGSVIEKTDISGKQFLDGMFNGVSGLVMSQICELTGLNTPAVQNWINRGWLSRPVKKKYNEDQVARILIINTLRETMSLENVYGLLYYVNGITDDATDDIVSEAELYVYICDITFSDATDGTIDGTIDGIVKDFKERRAGDALRLKTALKIVYLSGVAERYLSAAAKMLEEIHKNADNVR
ncbi:MAG: DUF1836 domain-containing protein [Clostridia bacterium]|nr:DUF1836 domain-containing protein [Clostridia bacterium]